MTDWWPPPADDYGLELGEDSETHLLPNLTRLRLMSRRERNELVRLVEDWDGPLVEEFRQRVRDLE